MKKLNRNILVLGLLIMIGAAVLATLGADAGSEYLTNVNVWIGAAALFFIIIALMATFQAMDAMKIMMLKEKGLYKEPAEDDASAVSENAWFKGIMRSLTDSVPVEEEEKVETDHVYDGIMELDNNLPPWWKWGFYISIVFAVVYLVQHHIIKNKPLSHEEYKIEMAEAEIQKAEYLKNAANLVDETNVTILTDETRVLSGKAIFTKNCAVCHAADGGGGVGPNLTDKFWLHGGSISDVFSTVKYGVPAKGMIPWKDQLKASEMQEVASYILTLQGTTPANPKEPQGEEYAPSTQVDDAAAPADSTLIEVADSASVAIN